MTPARPAVTSYSDHAWRTSPTTSSSGRAASGPRVAFFERCRRGFRGRLPVLGVAPGRTVGAAERVEEPARHVRIWRRSNRLTAIPGSGQQVQSHASARIPRSPPTGHHVARLFDIFWPWASSTSSLTIRSCRRRVDAVTRWRGASRRTTPASDHAFADEVGGKCALSRLVLRRVVPLGVGMAPESNQASITSGTRRIVPPHCLHRHVYCDVRLVRDSVGIALQMRSANNDDSRSFRKCAWRTPTHVGGVAPMRTPTQSSLFLAEPSARISPLTQAVHRRVHVGGAKQCGGTMRRVPEVIDAWFIRAPCPTPWHYPFEHQADFRRTSRPISSAKAWISAGVVLLAPRHRRHGVRRVVYKNVIVNELVLDARARRCRRARQRGEPWR